MTILQAEVDKSEKVSRVVARVRERVPPKDAAGAEELTRRLYGSVTPEDVLATDEDDLVGAACSLWSLAARRTPGEARVRVFNPTLDEDGWETPHTVVEVVNDDMPFLVSSVTAEIGRRESGLHLVLHPVLSVRRDARGKRLEVVERGEEGSVAESYMHLEVDQETDPRRLAELEGALEEVLVAVRRVVGDWAPMRQRIAEVVAGLAEQPPPLAADELAEGREFLAWLADNHFTFLGYREYDLVEEEGKSYLRIVPGTGLGLLRVVRDESERRGASPLPRGVAAFLRRRELLIVSKTYARSPVHRPVAMDYIAVRTFDASGKVRGERRFLGLFSSAAYQRSLSSVPLLRLKVRRLLDRLGFDPRGHNARTLRHLLDTFPRDELFQLSDDELAEIGLGILRLQERERVALFVRKDPFERFVSALVYVPRDRYSTRLRRRIERLLGRAFDGSVTSFSTQVGDAPLARAHFIFQTRPGGVPRYDVHALEAEVALLASTWEDRLRDALVRAHGEEAGLAQLRRYADAFPLAYREAVDADEALLDIEAIEEVAAGGGGLATRVYRPRGAAGNEVRFKVFHPAPVRPLSELLPLLEDMGLQVVWEVPYEVAPPGGGSVWIRDFLLASGDQVEIDLSAAQEAFRQAFARVWRGELESDGFNRLVVAAGLDWREVTVLRAYGRYLRQIGIAFSQDYMAATLARNPKTARHLVALFQARFDPALADAERAERSDAIQKSLRRSLQQVANLDEDRILRRFLNLMHATLRTNYFQYGADGEPKPYLAFKIDSKTVRRLPKPAPLYEIWVYSPRVEAIHLRGGKVARGGIRWSDRQMDFRTEILGLLKAQMVKNAVIVPVGAKGGFVVKRGAGLTRDELAVEGRECYRTMVRGLLDLTDNLAGEAVVPPPDVVRHDEDDPYLVVAADKGTARFSDLANEVAAEYGFWLGDAFAAGGSAGYDHKAMGITARGAWEAVERHFRELGKDVQSEDFTAVGVGDMAGDVFGNGMLLSKHTRLLGAFNHLHVFVDPDPDAAASWEERKRLFELGPRGSWMDYDPAKLSPGGAVYERSAKSLKVSPEARARFGLAKPTATPDELIRAMLRAEVDLLWFGGIGTFVKASTEAHGETGDRANDDVRVDAAELRAKVVGEGANLGFTQRGRIEYALEGGRINTDAIDNSAGVDTSDHEVNIKIALAGAAIGREERDRLLAAMTDEVAKLVLRDNYLQTQAISVAHARAAEQLPEQARLMRELERAGKLERAIEYLPDDDEIAARLAAGRGLTRPEIAVLLAYSKIALYQELLASSLPDEPELVADLLRYFPEPLREGYREALLAHRLRREIVATHVTNSTVNRVGPTFVRRMVEETGARPTDVARAYTIARDAFRLREVWSGIEALDNRVPAALQIAMIGEVDRLVDRATLWLLRDSGGRLDVARRVAEYGDAAAAVLAGLDDLLPPAERAELGSRIAVYRGQGVPAEVARFVAAIDVLGAVLDVVRLTQGRTVGAADVARVYFLVGSRLRLDRLRTAADAIADADAWHKAAAAALAQDLAAHQGAITRAVLDHAGGGGDPRAATEAWLARHAARVEPVDRTLSEIEAAAATDFAMLMVANHQLRLLAAG